MSIIENTIQFIEENNTKVIFKENLNGIEAFSLFINDTEDKAIVIEEDPVRTAARTNTILLHELSHLECPKSMYDFDTSINARKRRENKVNNYMIRKFIPVEVIKKLLLKELRPFEIAEELSIEEQTIKEAILLYKELGLLD